MIGLICVCVCVVWLDFFCWRPTLFSSHLFNVLLLMSDNHDQIRKWNPGEALGLFYIDWYYYRGLVSIEVVINSCKPAKKQKWPDWPKIEWALVFLRLSRQMGNEQRNLNFWNSGSQLMCLSTCFFSLGLFFLLLDDNIMFFFLWALFSICINPGILPVFNIPLYPQN